YQFRLAGDTDRYRARDSAHERNRLRYHRYLCRSTGNNAARAAHRSGNLRGVWVVGEYIWNQEVIAPADQWKWAVEGVQELGRHAAALGLEIAIELEPFHLSIVNSIDKMDRFLKDVGLANVKANIDVSHLALVKNGAE